LPFGTAIFALLITISCLLIAIFKPLTAISDRLIAVLKRLIAISEAKIAISCRLIAISKAKIAVLRRLIAIFCLKIAIFKPKTAHKVIKLRSFGGSMGFSDYQFISHWRVEGTCEEVADVIGDVESLPRWCPSVYLDARVLEPGDEHGVGKLVSVLTKGWLPYTLRWRFQITESRHPYGSTLQALDDFDGRGVWTFAQDGPFVNITYDWRIRVHKPFIKALSFLLKPLFAFNHRWAMARSEASLKLELLRRRARTPEERTRIPAPPPPTWPHKSRG